MNWFLNIGSFVLSFLLLISGLYSLFFPKKVRGLYLRLWGSSKCYITQVNVEAMKQKWYLVYIRFCGIFLIFFSILFFWDDIKHLKW